jgi:hypothetical protein
VAKLQEAEEAEVVDVGLPFDVDDSASSSSSSSSSSSASSASSALLVLSVSSSAKEPKEPNRPPKAPALIVPPRMPLTVESSVPRRDATELMVLQKIRHRPANAVPRSEPK